VRKTKAISDKLRDGSGPEGYGYGAVLMEADAVIADTKAKLGWLYALKLLDIAGAGFSKALDCGFDATSHLLIKR
jgi:hypothetical protein